MILFLKTTYFYLWFLRKSDLRVLITEINTIRVVKIDTDNNNIDLKIISEIILVFESTIDLIVNGSLFLLKR